MKILIIHLSDIHVKDSTTILKKRAEKIIDGVKNLETEIVQIIFTFTGDMAFSGKESEYDVVSTFLDELKDQANAKICTDIHFVIVPGNHDCLFNEGKEDARNEIIESLRKKDFKISGESILDICLENQKYFVSYCFDFYCNTPLNNYKGLFYQYIFETNGFKTSFNCINSSWISVINENEQYGKLGFPMDYLKGSLESNFSISLIHHPFNWFSLRNSKELKRYLVDNSDIVLTGHEHEPSQSGYVDYKGKKILTLLKVEY